jgi:hypothetical protein
MPYHVEVNEMVLDYLGRDERLLSISDLQKLIDYFDAPGGLADLAEDVRTDPNRRCSPLSHTFWLEFLFVDERASLRLFRLGLDDSERRPESCASGSPKRSRSEGENIPRILRVWDCLQKGRGGRRWTNSDSFVYRYHGAVA